MSNKKAISPVVATALLLVVAVSAVVGFQTWFNTYSTGMFTNVEQQSSSNFNTGIENLIGSTLYFKNGGTTNVTISSIKIGGNDCNISGSYGAGISTIDLSNNCTQNLSTSMPEIVVLTDNKIYSKKVFVSGTTNLESSSLDCSTLNGGDWIKVPGNSALNTSDFCVMKYEAKFVNLTGKTQDLATTGWRYDTATGDLNITSSPTPVSITYINLANARAACSNLGTGYHLITNSEWTTIARNAENNSLNWDSGVIGTGSMFRGHSDGLPNNILNVTNVSDYWDQTGQSTPSIEKRTFVLNNFEIIWDLSGNAYELVNDTCTQNSPWYSVPGWLDWNNINLAGVNQEKDLAGPIGPYTSTNGVGQYYGCTLNGNGFVRGGRWDFNTVVGVFTLYFYNPLNSGPSNGFRCSYIE